ncbi:MAG: hypothetical protein ACP5C4_04540 [Methanomicrobiales archaeon]
MARQRRIPVRSFGTNPPLPDAPDLVGWIEKRRGREGDLISYLLDESLRFQAGVDRPCAGGLFYGDRVESAIIGLVDGVLAEEPALRPVDIVMDARDAVALRKGCWVALPAPSLLGVGDRYFEDPGECTAALCDVYRRMMREMRDAGVGGHVLHCTRPDETELEELARPRARFFSHDPDPETVTALLEFQDELVISPDHLSDALMWADEFDIRTLTILDAASADLQRAVVDFDPGMIAAGGFCTADCEEYWTALVEDAVVTL